mmetsp:Transcript_54332/g.117593  ORF Transcript_54332/g.117593 Transcript_54332/m.117593 type:complete len:200 (+) Transcript_54332:84-683(+)
MARAASAGQASLGSVLSLQWTAPRELPIASTSSAPSTRAGPRSSVGAVRFSAGLRGRPAPLPEPPSEWLCPPSSSSSGVRPSSPRSLRRVRTCLGNACSAARRSSRSETRLGSSMTSLNTSASQKSRKGSFSVDSAHSSRFTEQLDDSRDGVTDHTGRFLVPPLGFHAQASPPAWRRSLNRPGRLATPYGSRMNVLSTL